MKSKHLFSILSILIIVAILAAAFPHPAQAALCKRTVTVQEGDNLRALAKLYHTTSNKIAFANNLDKPYVITPGQKLCIPSDNVPKGQRFNWNGMIKGNMVYLTGNDFRNTHTYFVNGKTSSKDRFYSLGKAFTNSSGDLNASFALPTALQNKNYVTICLKEKSSNATDCKRIFKQ